MKRFALKRENPLVPFDERDTVFARTRLIPSTQRYDDYYREHPELKKPDDRTRSIKRLASKGTKRYRPLEAALIEGLFDTTDQIAHAVQIAEDSGSLKSPDGLGDDDDNLVHTLPNESPPALTRLAKNAALFCGADDVGIAKLDPAFVYTHRGRPSSKYGEAIELTHTHAIVMVFAMDNEYVLSGPEFASTAETARNYLRAATASHALSSMLARLGFLTRAHVDSNYKVICPPLAQDAGLGELGRNGILIHPTFGPGVRIGIVTIDAELIPDTPRDWGIAEFCRTCAKCARECPSAAIPSSGTEMIRGAEKWPMNPERCYHYWRTQGSDCGICIRVCPFAKPNTHLHRWVRGVIKMTPLLNRLFIWGDDLVYGKSAKPTKPPLLDIGAE